MEHSVSQLAGLLTDDVRRALLALGGAPSTEPPTLRAVGELWLPSVRERGRLLPDHPDALLPTTVATYEAAWRRVEELRALDKPAVEETARWLLEHTPMGCRNAFGGALSAAFHAAGQGEEMASGRYWRYKPARNELEIGDLAEAAQAITAKLVAALDVGRRSDVSVATAAWLLPCTGARPGELVSLRRADLEDGRLKLRAKRAERWVPLAASVEAVLRFCAPHRGELLFPGRRGRDGVVGPIGVTAIDHALRRWGAPSPLRLRRLYASWLIDAGVPITVVAALLGHVDPATTLRHYARPTARAQQGVAERVIEALLGGQMSFPGMRPGQVVGSENARSEGLPAAPWQRMRIEEASNTNRLGRGRHAGLVASRKVGGRR